MHWAQLQETQFTPWSSSEIVENSQPALITPNTSFLIMKRDFMHNFRIFCTQIPAVLRIHLSMKWTPDFMGKKSNCESIPSLCTGWRNKLKKKKFLQLDHVPSKQELLLSYTVTVVTILWPFVELFLKHSSPKLQNFLRHFPANSYLKYSCTKNGHCSTVYLSHGTLLCHLMNDKCIHQQQTRWFIA